MNWSNLNIFFVKDKESLFFKTWDIYVKQKFLKKKKIWRSNQKKKKEFVQNRRQNKSYVLFKKYTILELSIETANENILNHTEKGI